MQEPDWFIGRICCDSEGRLNDSSVLLEGNIAVSGGRRTRLDLSRLPAYRYANQDGTPNNAHHRQPASVACASWVRAAMLLKGGITPKELC